MAKFIELQKLRYNKAYSYEPGDYHMINVDHIVSIFPYKDNLVPDLDGTAVYFSSGSRENFSNNYTEVRAKLHDLGFIG